MKKALLLILSIFFLFLTSCYDYSTVSKTLFVNTIAFDKDLETNEYIVYYHMTNPNSLTTASLGGGGDKNTFSIASSRGENIFLAMQEIEKNSNKNIKLSHIQIFIFTMNYFSYENLVSFHTFIKSSPYIYSDFYILLTDSKIDDIFKISDIEDASPYYSLIASANNNEETYKMTSYLQFSRGITEEYHEISFPLIRVRNDIWETQENKINSIYVAGSMYINKDNETFLADILDYPIISIIKSKDKSNIVIENIQYYISEKKFTIKTTEINNSCNINISLKVKALATYIDNYNRLEIEKVFIKEMEASLKKLILDSNNNNIDILSISNKLYRKNKLKSAFEYKNANYNINIEINIIKTQ